MFLDDSFNFFQHFKNCHVTTKNLFPYAVLPFCAFGIYKFLSYLVPGPHHQSRLELKNRTVLITGASSGLGRALAFEFFSKGAKLILVARSLNKLAELCNELEDLNQKNSWNNKHKPVYHYLDLAELSNENGFDIAQINHLRSLSIDGVTIDVVVSNAGVSNRGSCLCTSLNVQRRVMEVNFFGPVVLTQTLFDAIPDDGAIVTINSLQGRVALPYRSAYSASKHANQAFFDSMRGEERPNLQILTVNAGYINTSFGSNALDIDGRPVGREDPNQKKGLSTDVAAHRIVLALQNRETELVLATLTHRLIIWLRVLAPNFLWSILQQRAKRELEAQTRKKSSETKT